MGIHLVSIASGSKGNCTLIYTDTTAILVDAGICYSRIKNELYSLGKDIKDLKGVLITHEHIDHIKAVSFFDAPIYAHPLTYQKITEKMAIRNYARMDNYELGFSIGDINVTPFRISHDAIYPLGYTFEHNGMKVSVATDIGVLTNSVYLNLKESTAILFESNHDVDMLTNGPYPKLLKDRILSKQGHLSNVDSAVMVKKLATCGALKYVILGHMSETNNIPDLAYKNMRNALDEYGYKDITVYLSYPDKCSEEIIVQ